MRYINSGALYRAIAYEFDRKRVDPENPAAVGVALGGLKIESDGSGDRYFLGDEDVTEHLWTRETAHMASIIAKDSRVREKVNDELRRMAAVGDCIVEGRDIGTVVFPGANLKIFLEASPEERARRRKKDFEVMGAGGSLEEIGRELAERDQADSTRAVAPLRPPEGAVVCNSTGMTPQQVVDHLLALIRESPGLGH
jgi:cytidylate kinase